MGKLLLEYESRRPFIEGGVFTRIKQSTICEKNDPVRESRDHAESAGRY